MAALEQKHMVAGLLVVMIGLIIGQPMSDVCRDVPDDRDHANRRPRISNQFRVNVECSLIEQNRTAFVKEYYDLQRNRGRLTVLKPTSSYDYYMDYDKDLLLRVNPDTSGCEAGVLLVSNDDKFIFGFRMKDQNAQIFSPSGALHFSNVNESYNGTNLIRGILVDEWHSCQYLAAINATAHVTWHFSQKDTWDMQLGRASAPVRLTAIGKQGMPDGTYKRFNHIYDFFDYEGHVNPNDFEVDKGIFCPGRTLLGHPKVFPAVPNSFYFIGEINDPFGTVFSNLEEAYDNTTKYSMYRFKAITTQLTDVNHYTELNDYNSGVSFLIDNIEGSCSWSPISESAVAFSKTVNSQQVRMETPREFFMDKTVNYQYAGTSTIRNVPTERWVGVSDHARGYKGTNVTVEWHFAAEDHESWNNDPYSSASKYRLPVMFSMFMPGDVTSQSYEFHIFNFNVMKIGTFLKEVDVSQCFKGIKRTSFRFAIPKSYELTVRDNILATMGAIQNAISGQTGISSLRISDIRLYFNPLNVYVTFDMLDLPPNYNDVKSTWHQNPLDSASQLFQTAFKSGYVTFDLAIGDEVVTIVPRNDSLCMETANTTCVVTAGSQSGFAAGSQSGFAAGALAGLGVAMLVVGGAGGAVGAFFFFK